VQAGWSRYAKIHITALITIDQSTRAIGCPEVEAEPGDAVLFDSYAPHRPGSNQTSAARRVLYVTYNKASERNHLPRYYADKRESYPPDIEQEPGKDYVYRV
jgi:ectoine hydroxylase-related dioxygenase (phytanoyl-CoA dioxygenase family)